MKIQPIASDDEAKGSSKPLVKSRFKRLFEWQFSKEKLCGGDVESSFEPNSVCLAKMVQSFIEESHDKQKCSRNRCNCFNGNCDDGSDDDFYFSRRSGDSVHGGSSSVTCDVLKNLVVSVSNIERTLVTDTTKIVEGNKTKCKNESRRAVVEGLVGIGYDASICKSRWEKSASYPSGEYEYIDVMIEGERLVIDIDFKSEFEIARSTGAYRSVLQALPSVFVGKTDRLQKIVCIVSDAAKQSLKKKGMHIPPWRKTEYMRAKWLSPYTRNSTISTKDFSGEFELIFNEEETSESVKVIVTPWEPPAVKPKSTQKGTKMVAGLASMLKEKP